MRLRTLAFVLALLAPGGLRSAGALEPPSSVAPGDLFVLRVGPGTPVPAAVHFLDASYPPLHRPEEPGVSFFLLGVDLDTPAGRQELRAEFPGGRVERRETTVVPRHFPEERLALPPAMVTPPRELEARIAREQALTASVYRTSAAGQLWDRGFGPAVAEKASGNFGRRRILNGLPRCPHAGEDYSAPAGTPVHAIGRGRVRLGGDLYYSGLTILIDHGAGLVSQYLHLEKILVAEGDTVPEGLVIGLVGSTGRATGPHLHLGLRLHEQRVDPERLWGLFPHTSDPAPAAPRPPAP